MICWNTVWKQYLYSGKKHHSIPIAYAVHMKETYKNVKNILHKINYNEQCCNQKLTPDEWNVAHDTLGDATEVFLLLRYKNLV